MPPRCSGGRASLMKPTIADLRAARPPLQNKSIITAKAVGNCVGRNLTFVTFLTL